MSHTPLQGLGENAVLQRLLSCLHDSAPMMVGPGDDCAVVARNEEWDTLLKTDVVVENVHFTPDTEPRRIGRKALARAVSDIAAMGGLPEHALITILAHKSRPVELLEGIYRGIDEIATQFNISVAGGETSSIPYDGLVINVALTGRVEHGQAILRSGGRAGDVIFVTGPLGGSFPSEHHLDFTPRVHLARSLMLQGPRPTAMMDLSDGVAADLPRLAAASGCGFELTRESIPCNPGCSVEQALNDGEDYELLLTLSPLDAACVNQHPQLSLFPIGKLTNSLRNTLSGGWQHFSA
ncbi:MAG: thiamine-monophosphate kinase [Akkermansia sp.]|nr:thiamine-monophosphate kinase [Akkermansia sp.]